MATKYSRARGRNNWSSIEKESLKSIIEDETDSNQAGNDKNTLEL